MATGVGQTDVGAAMASGTTWFKVPKAIKVILTGKKPRFVQGKDIILTIIGKIGVDGARYQSLEFCGEGISELTMADRFPICNMAIEAGGKNGIFPVDEKTIAFLQERGVTRSWTAVEPDADAEYDSVLNIALDELVPVVAYPHLPENTHPASESNNIIIDQSVIGSCTNGRLEDLAQAAEVLKGRKVHPHVRCIIIPATQEIYKKAMALGYVDIFIDAGAAVSTPTCGPCLGGYMGILAHGERAISTTNRNFRGRMGHDWNELLIADPGGVKQNVVTQMANLIHYFSGVIGAAIVGSELNNCQTKWPFIPGFFWHDLTDFFAQIGFIKTRSVNPTNKAKRITASLHIDRGSASLEQGAMLTGLMVVSIVQNQISTGQ